MERGCKNGCVLTEKSVFSDGFYCRSKWNKNAPTRKNARERIEFGKSQRTCDPLSRGIGVLGDGGLNLVQLKVVDVYVGTPHIDSEFAFPGFQRNVVLRAQLYAAFFRGEIIIDDFLI